MIIKYYELQELAGDKWRRVSGDFIAPKAATHDAIMRKRKGHTHPTRVVTVHRIVK